MRSTWSRWCAALAVFPLVPALTLAAEQATGDEGIAGQLVAAARHAETYHLLGMVEEGDLRAAEAGLGKLEDAKELLNQRTLPPEITAIEEELNDQIKQARGTLQGIFPLARFLTSPLFADSGPTATYQLIDDPAVNATRIAAADLAVQVLGQLPVVFTAVPPGKTRADGAPQASQNTQDRLQARVLEHAARQVFRGLPRFRVLTHAAVASALAPAENGSPRTALESFRAGDINPVVSKMLLAKFGPRLLVVVIRQVDVTEDVSYYRADGRILDAMSGAQQASFVANGFGRDRRVRLAWILWANLALLVAAYAAYALVVYAHHTMESHNRWLTLLLLPLVAFIVGHTLPYAVSPLLGLVRLPPEMPVLTSFWIACLAGLVLFAAPLAAYWLASPWLAELWPNLSMGNRGGALFAAMGTGIAAHFAGPLLLYSDKHPAIDVMLMSLSVMVLAYLLGRSLDYSDPLPLSLAFVPLILAMPAGAALLHAQTMWLGLAAGSIAVTATAIVVANAMHANRRLKIVAPDSHRSPADRTRIDGDIPADVQGLVQRAETPDYQRFPSFDEVWNRMRDFIEGRCCHLGLFGSRGAGKTPAVRTMTRLLVQELETRGTHPVLLCGSCPQSISEPISYAPFRDAFAQHFEVGLLAGPGPKMEQISQALSGIFGSVIPFARILFQHSAGTRDATARPDEIHASIAWMLRRLSNNRPVLLFLDDVQWLDEASAALVRYLLKEFPAGSNTPLAVILVANSKSCLENLGFEVARYGVEIEYPTVEQQAQILVHGVGLHPTVASDVLKRTGEAREADGGLLWPLQVVARLARSDALVRTENGFAWAGGAWPADFAIPAHMQAAMQKQWDGAAQYHTVLACAACGCDGLEFRVSVIADALNRTRLDLLMVLNEIERTTGMVHDVRNRDDIYAFYSSFLLDVIRGKLGVTGMGARKGDIPQIVREYHARLAMALEPALKTSPSKLYEIANHFYTAGARYATKAAEYCLEAASDSATSHDFRRARNYLEMAEACGALPAAGPLAEAASQGEQRVRTAAAGLAYLKEHRGAPARLALAVARLCYDVGHRSHEPRWCEDAARLCRQIVAHPASLQEEAEARHIMAVSLPKERRAERIAELRKAYGLLEHAADEDQEAVYWFAQIVNSLAKELSKGTVDERSEAKRLFECRLQLDAQRQLGDLRGTAMANAGLGRLEWYAEPKNVAAAEKYFERNLAISEAIGDIIAEVKMHSLLGACALEKDDLQQALAHYQRSWELAGDLIDRCFAAVGLLRCYQRQNRPDQFEAMARQLLGLLEREKIPFDCQGPLQAVFTTCPMEFRGETVRRLRDLTQH